MFITAFTSARHLPLSWAISIQSMPLHPTSWKLILIFSSHLRLGLPSGFFPSGIPTKTLYTPILSPILATCPAHLVLLDLMTRTIWGEEYRSLSSSLCFCLHSYFRNNLNSLSTAQLQAEKTVPHFPFTKSSIRFCYSCTLLQLMYPVFLYLHQYRH